MEKLLQLSYDHFFLWGADDALDAFARYSFTLESGFPEEAIKVLIRHPAARPALWRVGRLD